MGKKILLCCVMVLLMAAAAGPLDVAADGDPLASPTPRPTQRITAPVIYGVNPQVTLPEGDLGDITPSGSLFPGESLELKGIAPPSFVELRPAMVEGAKELMNGDVSCGPAALAQAMRLLNGEGGRQGPEAKELEDFLRKRGLMYAWGTGVEELVYAARSHGFPGSQSVHHWRLDELLRELKSGNPVVVPLGINGPGQPGHFLVLTGVSPDGEWINCIDPNRGKITLSRAEFSSLWELQGRAGVILAKFPLSASADSSLPWMGLLGALSAVGLALNRGGELNPPGWYRKARKKLADPQRKGIGGGIIQPGNAIAEFIPGVGPDLASLSAGTRYAEVPVYEYRRIQVGTRKVKHKVPIYETRRVQVGYKKEIRQVPTYKRIKTYCGTRLVDKKISVTRYRMKKVWVWKKVTTRAPATRQAGSGRIILGSTQTRWKWVQTYKKVPYKSTRTIKVKVPVYEYRRVQTGTRSVTSWVPRYEQKQILAGYRIVEQSVPHYETRRVQVGTRLEALPASEGDSKAAAPLEEDGNPLSVEDQRLIDKLDGVDPTDEEIRELLSQEGQAGEGDPTENWLYQIILFFQNLKVKIGELMEKLGAHRDPQDVPYLFSLTTQADALFNAPAAEAIQVNSFQPPHFLDLFYTTQELSFGPKIVATLHPDGLMDFNLSSKTWSMPIGNTTIFTTMDGETGFKRELKKDDSGYDQKFEKHSFRFVKNSLVYTYKVEGIFNRDEFDNQDIEAKQVDTLKCKTFTFHLIAIVAVVLSAVLFWELLFFLFSQGLTPQIPIIT